MWPEPLHSRRLSAVLGSDTVLFGAPVFFLFLLFFVLGCGGCGHFDHRIYI